MTGQRAGCFSAGGSSVMANARRAHVELPPLAAAVRPVGRETFDGRRRRQRRSALTRTATATVVHRSQCTFLRAFAHGFTPLTFAQWAAVTTHLKAVRTQSRALDFGAPRSDVIDVLLDIGDEFDVFLLFAAGRRRLGVHVALVQSFLRVFEAFAQFGAVGVQFATVMALQVAIIVTDRAAFAFDFAGMKARRLAEGSQTLGLSVGAHALGAIVLLPRLVQRGLST